MAWRIEFAVSAEKQLGKLERATAKRITTYLKDWVGDDPRALGGALEGPLGELWRYRVGDYRVLCNLEDEILRVLVVKIGDRKEVYR